MITIFEKIIKIDGAEVYVECEPELAEFIHYCYNDEEMSKPCKRVLVV